jgi:hypothetical protein
VPQIDTNSFTEPGLYLVWPDGKQLDLTRTRIEALAREMLDDPSRIPPHVKAAADYQACDICPQRDTAEICHSIMAALPFMDEIDRYMSYDRVTAVFRDEEGGILHAVETSMQEALKYVSILALTRYCEVGREYGVYFKDVDPLMTPSRIAAQVYQNIFVETGGDMHRAASIITDMQERILHTTQCQAGRLRLISQRDAFLNAFVAAHTTVQFVFLELNGRVSEQGTPRV